MKESERLSEQVSDPNFRRRLADLKQSFECRAVHGPTRVVTVALRLREIDVLTAQEDGSTELDDGRLLNHAAELGRVLVSQDEDLLREGA